MHNIYVNPSKSRFCVDETAVLNTCVPIYANNLVKVCLNNILNVLALIDSGTSITCMNVDALNLLRSKGQRCVLYECDDLNIVSINGSKLMLKGCVYLRVYLGDNLLRLRVYVIENMRRKFIIGIDTLSKYKAVLDYAKESLSVNCETCVYTKDNVQIAPHTERIVTLCTRKVIPNSVKGQVYGNKCLNEKGLYTVTKEIVTSHNSNISCKIKNSTNKYIKLNKNTKIGVFCPIKQNNITKPNENESSVNELNSDNENENEMYDEYDIYNEFIKDNDVNEMNEVALIENDALQFDISKTKLKDEEKTELLNLLNSNRNVFSQNAYDLGLYTGTPMQIELKPGSKPVRAPQYRLSPKQKQIVQNEIQKLLKAGIIEEIDYSDFSSPIMLISKSFDENGHPTEHRLVIDSRKVNDLIVDNVYEIPNIADLIESLGDTEKRKPAYFTVLDCSQGYHQIPLHKNSRKYTAFSTNTGMYQYTRCPMGCKVSPNYYMSVMNKIFKSLIGHGVYCYMDDIIIYSDDFFSHLKLLQRVFQLLKQHNLKLKLS